MVNLKTVWTKSVNRNSVVVRTAGDNGDRVKVKVTQSYLTLATPWTTQSMGYSRPWYWSGQLFPSPGDLPDPGIEPGSPALQADSLPAELPENLFMLNVPYLKHISRVPILWKYCSQVRGRLWLLQKLRQETKFCVFSKTAILEIEFGHKILSFASLVVQNDASIWKWWDFMISGPCL